MFGVVSFWIYFFLFCCSFSDPRSGLCTSPWGFYARFLERNGHHCGHMCPHFFLPYYSVSIWILSTKPRRGILKACFLHQNCLVAFAQPTLANDTGCTLKLKGSRLRKTFQGLTLLKWDKDYHVCVHFKPKKQKSFWVKKMGYKDLIFCSGTLAVASLWGIMLSWWPPEHWFPTFLFHTDCQFFMLLRFLRFSLWTL